MYIYLDESGDLGFDFSKRGTSDYFVITILVCENQLSKRSIARAVRRTIRNKINPKNNPAKTNYELKGTNTALGIKEYFYKHIKSGAWSLYSMILNKRRVYERFHTAHGQSRIYNFLARQIIEKIPLSCVMANVRMVVDKSKNKAEILDFNEYIGNYIQGSLPLHTGFSIEHLDSHEDPCLQAVDLFCWGLARKYKYADLIWYNVFSEKIKFEDIYLP